MLQVVELLLSRGANKEHRNVSDYTPLSLAASGGYVNIIKLLLSHGAEINSRTGSKLGISPLMLAAMNGHTQAVKLLLDMGSDINAQVRIKTGTVTNSDNITVHSYDTNNRKQNRNRIRQCEHTVTPNRDFVAFKRFSLRKLCQISKNFMNGRRESWGL